MDFIRKNRMWITLGGLALALIGCFMPFAKASVLGFSQTVNYTDGDGILVVIAVIISAVLVFLKKEKFSLIPSGIGALITIYDMINTSRVASGLASVSLGIGAFVVIIGLIVAIIMPLIPQNK